MSKEGAQGTSACSICPFQKTIVGESKYGSPLVPIEMPGHIALERLKIIVSRKDGVRKIVPEFTSCVKERLEIAVNFCTRKLDRKGVRTCGKSCVVCPP